MRIISGKHARKVIVAPPNLPVRPTTDFAKEGLFNILRNHFHFEGLSVLDLFSGTGNIAFEFAARGADEVFAVDIAHRCVSFIRKTAHRLEFDSIIPIKSDAFAYVRKAKRGFDIVFADPPYEMDETRKLPDMVLEGGLVNPDGWLIVEHARELSFAGHPNLLETRKYGKVNFSFFSNEANG